MTEVVDYQVDREKLPTLLLPFQSVAEISHSVGDSRQEAMMVVHHAVELLELLEGFQRREVLYGLHFVLERVHAGCTDHQRNSTLGTSN